MARRILFTSKKKQEKKSPLEINETLVKGAAWSNYQTGGETSLSAGDWDVNAFDKAFNSSFDRVRSRLNKKDATTQGGKPGGTTNNYYGDVNTENTDNSTTINTDNSTNTQNIENQQNVGGDYAEGDINKDIDNSQTDNSQTDNSQVDNSINSEGGDIETGDGDLNKTTNQNTNEVVEDDEPDVVEPDVVEPDVVEPDVVEPDVVEPDVVEPDVVEPDVVDPNVNKVDNKKSNTNQENIVNNKTTDVNNTNTVTNVSAGVLNPDYPEFKYQGPEVKFGDGVDIKGKPLQSVDELLPTDKSGNPSSFTVKDVGKNDKGEKIYKIKSKGKTFKITEQQYNESIGPHVKSVYKDGKRHFYRNDVSSPQESRWAARNRDKYNRSGDNPKTTYGGSKVVRSGFLGSQRNKEGYQYSNYNYTNPGGYGQESPGKYISPVKYSNKESALQYRLGRKSKLNPGPFKYIEQNLPADPNEEVVTQNLPADNNEEVPTQDLNIPRSNIWDVMSVLTPDKVDKMTDEYISNLSLFGDEKSVETLGSDAKMEIGRFMNEQKEIINQMSQQGDPASKNQIETTMMDLKKVASKFNVIAENKALWIEAKTDNNLSKGSKIDNMFMADLVYSESPLVKMAIMGGGKPEIFFKVDGVDEIYNSSQLTDNVFQTDLESMTLYGTAVNQLRQSAKAGEAYSEGNVDALVSQMAKDKEAQLSFLWDGEDHLGIDIAGHLAEMYGSETISALHPNHSEFSEAYLEDVVKIALKSYLKREFNNSKPKPKLNAKELVAKYTRGTLISGAAEDKSLTSKSRELIEKYS